MNARPKQSSGPAHDEIGQARQKCPLPVLMRHLRLGAFEKKSCRSPFREEKNASFGVYWKNDRHYWKDFGSDQGGDEIAFLAEFLHIDEQDNFRTLVNVFKAISEECDTTIQIKPEVNEPRELPDRSPFKAGTAEQIQKLSKLRHIRVDALQWAQDRGVLVFGDWNGHEVFGVTDKSGEIVEIRRLDGELFPEAGDLKPRKSHAIKGSDKSWPVGITEASTYPCIALTEGLPDFLAAHDFVLKEQDRDGNKSKIRCAPVGMLTASTRIDQDALEHFKGKVVWIYPHADQAGMAGAARWLQQLQSVGAKSVRTFDSSAVHHLSQGKVKDLNDLLKLNDPELIKKYPALNKILPDGN